MNDIPRRTSRDPHAATRETAEGAESAFVHVLTRFDDAESISATAGGVRADFLNFSEAISWWS